MGATCTAAADLGRDLDLRFVSVIDRFGRSATRATTTAVAARRVSDLMLVSDV